jgi:hypothetical protein
LVQRQTLQKILHALVQLSRAACMDHDRGIVIRDDTLQICWDPNILKNHRPKSFVGEEVKCNVRGGRNRRPFCVKNNPVESKARVFTPLHVAPSWDFVQASLGKLDGLDATKVHRASEALNGQRKEASVIDSIK